MDTPIELKHWHDEDRVPCAFCSKAHARFERRRSYRWNGRPVLVRVRLCDFCKTMYRVSPGFYQRREIQIAMRMMRDHGIIKIS